VKAVIGTRFVPAASEQNDSVPEPAMIDDPLLPRAGLSRVDDRRARWCVWAPRADRVELVLDPEQAAKRVAMSPCGRGFHEATADLMDEGRRYAYSLDGGDPLPDPDSRWQPEGVGGPSAVLFPESWSWEDGGWRGIERPELVFYELHVGTFTPEGTFDAVIPRIDSLRELGITAIELMPVGQFPGVRGWGYDGVFPSAPQHSYGGPSGLKRLIEACHRQGMAVVLDVVWNHFGPEGNVFPRFGHYFNDRYRTDWGPAINYDGPHADPVRAMVLENVRMWVRDYHVDGLRIDAADQIYDRSPRHILAEMAVVAHEEARQRGYPCHLFAETDLNDAHRFLDPPERGGYALDGHWNDDFHHAAHVVLTGDTTGYFRDFAGGPAAVAKVFGRVFVNDGTYSAFRDRRHGATAEGLALDRFVAFVQNHDQVANGNAGRRHAAVLSPPQARLAAGLLLLAPRLPLLFQGEEYGETNDFPYFCDYSDANLVEAVRKGRAQEFAHFGRTDEPPDPVDPATRDAAVLSWSWDDPGRANLRRLYGNLLRLRRERVGLRDFAPPVVRREGGILDVVRGDTRVVFNLGGESRPIPQRSGFGTILLRSGDESLAGVLAPYEFIVQA
jgi:maltooligosyltrehalose trehalohydrolase